MYEFGATRYFDNGWHVSGAMCSMKIPCRTAYYSPLVADLNRNFFSFGTGFSASVSILTSPINWDSPSADVTGSQPPVNAITATSGGHPAARHLWLQQLGHHRDGGNEF